MVDRTSGKSINYHVTQRATHQPIPHSHSIHALLLARSTNYEHFNWSFPSSLVPLFQNESKCETFHMKMSSACSFIFMQIKVIFIRMVSHLDSL